MTRTPRLRCGGVAAALLLWMALPVHAEPYRPADDALVLETLPAAAMPREGSASRVLTAEQAALLARVHIQRARDTGDPRHLGYAQGVLAPWWSSAEAPDAVLLMRATLRQSRHDFSGALNDLDRLLSRRPANAQAWLTRATILRVLGRYPEARGACARLDGLAEPFVSTLCARAIRGLAGELSAAAAALDALRPTLGSVPQALSAWYFAERAEMAARAGDLAHAETLYREALPLHPADLDLRASYADLLLDRGKLRDALALVDANSAVDALRLRRALVLHALGDPAFAALDAQIRDGFAAARRRGEALHLREEARYLLATSDDSARALKLAQDNWAIQHEPWDARLLLAAALAAKQPAAAAPVRAWMAQTGFEDARLPRAATP